MSVEEPDAAPTISAVFDRFKAVSAADEPAGQPSAAELYFLRPSAVSVPPKERDALQDTLNELTAGVHTLNAGHVASAEQIRKIEDALQAVHAVGARMTAPVVLPAENDIAVRLVPATLLETLAEHYSDENRQWAWFGVIAGGLIGMVCGLVLVPAGTGVPQSAWVLIAAMVLMSVYVLRELKRVQQRIARVRARLFPEEPAASHTSRK